MVIQRLVVSGSIAVALCLAVACYASEPPEEVAEKLEGGLHRGAWISFRPRDVSRRPARTGFYDTPGVLEAPEVKWTFQADGAIISSAIVFEDKVLFGSDDSNFYALNVETGQPEWIVETGGQVRSSPMVADGVVYFGGDDKLLRAVNAETGEEVWSFEAVVSIRSSPVAAGGSIYVGSDSNVFYSFDARTGLLNWEKIVHDDEDRFIRSSPAVAGDTVYVVTATSRPPFFKSTLHALGPPFRRRDMGIRPRGLVRHLCRGQRRRGLRYNHKFYSWEAFGY